jgi:DNA-binding CsgD family transcriptional regulator
VAGQNLTLRESQIVALVAEGKTNSQIALQLDISPNTVRAHLETVFLKLGISNRVELAVWVVRAEASRP